MRLEDVNWTLDEFTFKDTKNRENRTLPLLPHLAAILERQEPVDGFFFGGSVFKNSLRLAWEKARTAVDLEDLHLHDFRHMASSWMQRQGVDFISNEYVLGHKIPGMLGYYAQSYPEGVHEALTKLAQPFPNSDRRVTNRWQIGETGTEGENPLDGKSARVIEL